MMCSTELVVVATSRTRTGEPLLPRFPHPDLKVQQTCLRVVVPFTLAPPEDHPPRTGRLVNLGRHGLEFHDGAPQIGEGEHLEILFPVALKIICVPGARGIDTPMVSVLLSEMVRPDALKTSMKTTHLPQSARRPRHDARVFSIQQTLH